MSPGNFIAWLFYLNPGNYLLSHSLTTAVTSALEGLTSVFGMGTGGTPPAWSPRILLQLGGGGGETWDIALHEYFLLIPYCVSDHVYQEQMLLSRTAD